MKVALVDSLRCDLLDRFCLDFFDALLAYGQALIDHGTVPDDSLPVYLKLLVKDTGMSFLPFIYLLSLSLSLSLLFR